MEIQSNHMVDPSDCQEICQHTRGDGATMALLLGLAGIREVPRLRQHHV